jgi:6-phosphofructokinase
MNACIRAIVKAARHRAHVVGVRKGAAGLARDRRGEGAHDYFSLHSEDVGSILDRSGTMLGTTRAAEVAAQLHLDHRSEDYFARYAAMAAASLLREDVGGLILMGGDSTCTSASQIFEACDRTIPIVVVPASIDNDVVSTSTTLGFQSAVEEAVRAVDRIRETAMAMNRVFIIEVMGNHNGSIAAHVALATGAEAALVPEHGPYTQADVDAMCARLSRAMHDESRSAVLIVAEGAVLPSAAGEEGERRVAERTHTGYAMELALKRSLEDQGLAPLEVRTTILGHTQRGASPTAQTRFLAAQAGTLAVDELLESMAWRSEHATPLRECAQLISVREGDRMEFVPIDEDMHWHSAERILELVAMVDRLSY